MSALYVDDRYRGAHGIGRYAGEVLPRLRPEWRPLGLDGSPHSPVDAFRSLPAPVRAGTVYSPGYGALVRAGMGYETYSAIADRLDAAARLLLENR